MIESLQIEGFRAFENFSVSGLGRINLLVGDNNSGKTSLLEAIQVVASGADPQALWSIASRRGEFFFDDIEPGYRRPSEIDVNHWFRGFDFDLGSAIRISAIVDGDRESCELTVVAAPADTQRQLFPGKTRAAISNTTTSATTTTTAPSDGWLFPAIEPSDELPSVPELALLIETSHSATERLALLSARGGAQLNSVRLRTPDRHAMNRSVVFVPTSGLSAAQLVPMLDDIMLTELEELVLRAMQTIDSKIEKVAPKGREGRVRIEVRLAGTSKPLPIGILGDGVSRLLILAVALAKARNGILLVDEIDTGLHFTAMSRMWRFVSAAALKLNVQVFATTHSQDCVRALASICEDSPSAHNISMQRVERAASQSVTIKEDGVIAVAERGIEVR